LSRCAATLLSTPPLISIAICLDVGFCGAHAEKLAGINSILNFSDVIITAFHLNTNLPQYNTKCPFIASVSFATQ